MGKTLDAGDDLESDHPGFNDVAYRARRSAITEMAKSYKAGMGKIPNPIPPVEYSDSEMGAWGQVYDRLMQLYPLYACSEANANMKLLQRYAGYSRDSIPQLEDVNTFLREATD